MRAAATGPALAAALALATTGLSCAVPRGTAEHPSITSFEIVGTKALDAGDVRAKLATQPSDPWWKLFWRGTSYFDEDAFANDRKRVERMYQSEGFYGAKVVDALVEPDGPGRVKLRMRIDEGRPSTVSELRIDGLDAAPEARAKLGKLPLRQGGRFTEAAFDATKAEIVKALETTGYAKAEVEQRAEVDPRTGEVRVVYTVEPGLRYRFGNVFVSGAYAIPRTRLREEADTIFKPGDWFDTTDLTKLQGRIFDLGVFGGVRVTEGPPDPQRKSIPVVLAVREAPFHTIRAGPGLGVQLNRWDVNVVAGWTHRNWLGGLRKLSFDGRVGYAWLPQPFSPTRQGLVGLAGAEFTQPGVVRRRIDFNTRVEVERGLEEAYSFWSERFRFGFPIALGRTFAFVPSYNLELYQTTGTVNTVIGETPTGGAGSELLSSCGSTPNCLLSYFEQRIAIDLRDDPINTKRGVYLAVAFQEGFKLFGNGFPYLRFLPEARFFLPAWKSSVVGGRLRIGTLRSLNGSEPPVVARMYSGGPNLMRGYYTRRLSPVVNTTDQGYVPVGGTGLVDGSVELRAPIAGNLGGALFLDFGNTTPTIAEALDLGNLQYAVGVGLRYNTVFGPLRVDVAGRLPKRTAEGWQMPGVAVLEQTVAGGPLVDTGIRHHEPIVSVQLSIGEAF